MIRLRRTLLAAAVTLPVLPAAGFAGPSVDLPRLSFPPAPAVSRACTDPTAPLPATDACTPAK